MPALLSTKLHIPTPRPSLVTRHRLVDRLDEALAENRRLILVSAPAGSGKTTLLATWVSHLPPGVARAGWLSLDERDDDPARFLAYLVAALQHALPGTGTSLLHALRDPQPPPLETLLTALVNELDAVADTRLILVLDDYHTLKAPPVHQAVAFLLDSAPPHLHLVVAGRSDPPLPVARLRGRGQLAELRAADLRFTVDEAAAFANEVMGLSLSPAHVAALETRTEGWITGLQLAALSLRRRDPDDVPAFLNTLTGSNRYILDYLVEEVLAREPHSVQEFLLHTSILDRLCAGLCDALMVDWEVGRLVDWEIGGLVDWAGVHQPPNLPLYQSTILLHYLETSNLFLIPLDDERRWYRYHRLFADLLRARLAEDQARELHTRASAWFETGGYTAEAFEHALKGGDVERAARLVEGAAMEMLTRGELATLLGWLGALPEAAVRARPRLCLYHAWALVLTGQVARAETRLVDAGTLPGELLGHAAAIRAYGAAIGGDTDEAAAAAGQALDLLPKEEGIVRSVVAFTLGGLHLLRDDVGAAAEAFARAVEIGRRAGNLHVVLPASHALAQLQRVQGRLRDAAATYCQALALAGQGGAPRTPTVGSIYAGLADLDREWNNLDAAEEQVRRGLALVEQWGNSDSLAGTRLALARLLYARGDLAGAAATVDAAQQALAGRVSNPLSEILVASYRQRLRLARGELGGQAAAAAAADWAAARGLAATGPISYLHEPEYLALVRLLLAAGQAEQAAELAARVTADAHAAGRKGTKLEALLLRARALDTAGKREAAGDALGSALALAAPEGYVRTFLDEGETMVALLRAVAARAGHRDYVNTLLEAAGTPPRPSPPREQPLAEPLTGRELEVLALVAAGLTNRDIAGRLVIEVSTVKSHTNSLYGKLGVKNRTQAVARAHELGILG